jgi:carboxyl-terminal processing protease
VVQQCHAGVLADLRLAASPADVREDLSMKRFALTAIILIILVAQLPAQESFDDTIQKSAERLAKIYYRKLNVTDLVRAARAASTADTDKAMQAMIASLNDPGIQYFTRAEVQELGIVPHYPPWYRNRIGLFLEQDPHNGAIRVRMPIKDGPAFEAGVRTGDQLVLMARDDPSDPKETEVISFSGMSAEEVDRKLCGLQNTRLRLELVRDGWPMAFVMRIPKGDGLHPETLFGVRRGGDAEWNFMLPGDLRIGYLLIDRFSPDTVTELRRARQKLENFNAKGLIIDLRFCPGHLLTSAVGVCEEFLHRGRIASFQGQFAETEEYDARPGHNAWSIPLVCLVNGKTASAGEIVAASLQDNHRALIVGERSAGKADVQNIANFPGHCMVKYTFMLFRRPDGRKLSRLPLPGHPEDEWGVTPDRVCVLADKETYALRSFLVARAGIHPESHREPPWEHDFRDRQLEAAVELLRGQLSMK